MKMSVQRVANRSELGRIRVSTGYVLNLVKSGARIHRLNCPTVFWIKPTLKREVYYAPNLSLVQRWLKNKSIEGIPCKICLPKLTYQPRPEKLTERI